MLPLDTLKQFVKFIGGFPGKQGARTSNFTEVQNGLHENRVASLKPESKASCVGQVVAGYAYAYAIRKVLLTKLCAKSSAAVMGIIKYICLMSRDGWELDDTIILPRTGVALTRVFMSTHTLVPGSLQLG